MSALLDRTEEAEAHRRIGALADGDLFAFTFEALPLGEWIPYGLRIEYFGERWQELPDLAAKARGWLCSAVSTALACRQLLSAYRPDVVLTLDGLLPCERVVLAMASRQGVRALSYENSQRQGSVIIREDRPAILYDFAREWAEWGDVPLSEAERGELDRFLADRRRGPSVSEYVYSPGETGALSALRRRLGLQPGRPVLVAFAAAAYDVSVYNGHTAFDSQEAWLDACIRYAAVRPDIDLIVRCHPAEVLTWRARQGAREFTRDAVEAVIARHWPVLPDNVRVVGPDSAVSSYDLLRLSQVVLVYVSTVGLEAAAMGIPVLRAGHTHYAVCDVTWPVPDAAGLPAQLDRLLTGTGAPPGAQERAYRYLYLWFFRGIPRMTAFGARSPGTLSARYSRLSDLEAGLDPEMDRLCQYVRGAGPFIVPPAAWRPRDPATGGAHPSLIRPCGLPPGDSADTMGILAQVPERRSRMQRFGIFSLIPHLGNVVREAVLSAALNQAGDEAIVVVCNGAAPRCLIDMLHVPGGSRTLQCVNCHESASHLHQKASGGRSVLLPLSDLLDEPKVADWHDRIRQIPDADLFDYTFDGMPIGEWVKAALRIEYFGEHWIRLPDRFHKARLWLMSVVTGINAVERFIDHYRPDALIVLNGLSPVERAIWTVARRRRLRCILYEGGQRPGTVVFREDKPACLYDFTVEWQDWRTVPLSAAESRRLDSHLADRQLRSTVANYVYSPAATGDLAAVRQRLDLAPDRPVVVAFSNMTADTSVFEAQRAFASQGAWLQACVTYAVAHPDLDVVIRIHPAESMIQSTRCGELVVPLDLVARELSWLWPELPPNVRIIEPRTSVSSYDLLRLSRVVLVYVSTVGLEAAEMGLPVISAGRYHYSGTGTTYELETQDEFAPLLTRLLAQPQPPPQARELARRYLYFWLFRCPRPMNLPKAGVRAWMGGPDLDADLQNLVRYVRGEISFVDEPPPWRPRDPGPPTPLPAPARAQILVLPDWQVPAEVCNALVQALPACPHPHMVQVLVEGLPITDAVDRLVPLARSWGDAATWPDIDVIPAPDTPEALAAVLSPATALVIADGQAGSPLVTFAAHLAIPVFRIETLGQLVALLGGADPEPTVACAEAPSGDRRPA